MPELPDVTVYVEALRERIVGHQLVRVLTKGPFLLRSATPPLAATFGHTVREVRRLGKQIAIGMKGGLWLVLHLKIAGRLIGNRLEPSLAAGTRLQPSNSMSAVSPLPRRARSDAPALHVVDGEEGLRSLDVGGLEPLEIDLQAFGAALQSSNHTLKRALDDPHILSGIGNAYSDEILHRAQLSPIAMTQKLTTAEIGRLHAGTRETLIEWTDRLRTDAHGAFPEKVTAFRPEMAVHGRYGEPCPRCQTKVQRIRHAANETNYCPRCQTGGRLLADRALSRLLHEDWPRTLDELEARKRQ